jgi:hypothetical protein
MIIIHNPNRYIKTLLVHIREVTRTLFAFNGGLVIFRTVLMGSVNPTLFRPFLLLQTEPFRAFLATIQVLKAVADLGDASPVLLFEITLALFANRYGIFGFYFVF